VFADVRKDFSTAVCVVTAFVRCVVGLPSARDSLVAAAAAVS